MLFFIVVRLIYISTSDVPGCFSCALGSTNIFCLLIRAMLASEVASHWNFDLQLLNNYDDEHLLTHILAISLFSFGKYVF